MDMRSARIKPVVCVSKAPKRSSSRACINWKNGNCMYKQDCWHLHSWSDDILTKLHGDSPKAMRFVWWTTPPNDFVKINCDGAFSTCHRSKAFLSVELLEIGKVHLSAASPLC
ncbi:hypothetical protein VNO78_27052 [Psophocarpus tetragonolobus]|uniref:C3H1-type domain-containing protein n=1 Tax=Psophocarpus tetragonolobus TaxID=3891 RepID=A0AAN9S0D4_PSOTE